jgi:hypothetical protein
MLWISKRGLKEMQDEQPIQQGNTQFHIAEYTALRAELLSNVKSSYDAVTYVSIANSAIFSWLAKAITSNANYALCVVAAWFPLLLTLGGWALFLNRNAAIARLSAYFRLVEDVMSSDGLGWERYAPTHKRRRHVFHMIFLVNLILSISLGVLITYLIIGPWLSMVFQLRSLDYLLILDWLKM